MFLNVGVKLYFDTSTVGHDVS